MRLLTKGLLRRRCVICSSINTFETTQVLKYKLARHVSIITFSSDCRHMFAVVVTATCLLRAPGPDVSAAVQRGMGISL